MPLDEVGYRGLHAAIVSAVSQGTYRVNPDSCSGPARLAERVRRSWEPPASRHGGGPSSLQVREDGEDAPVVVGRRDELELREDVRDVGFDGLRSEEESIADRLVRAALGHQPEDLVLALGQVVERDA